MARLEGVVARLESGELTLDEAVENYRDGRGLLKGLQAHLDAMEKKIEMLTTTDETVPFDDEEAQA